MIKVFFIKFIILEFKFFINNNNNKNPIVEGRAKCKTFQLLLIIHCHLFPTDSVLYNILLRVWLLLSGLQIREITMKWHCQNHIKLIISVLLNILRVFSEENELGTNISYEIIPYVIPHTNLMFILWYGLV